MSIGPKAFENWTLHCDLWYMSVTYLEICLEKTTEKQWLQACFSVKFHVNSMYICGKLYKPFEYDIASFHDFQQGDMN